jgi:hypothetical protein
MIKISAGKKPALKNLDQFWRLWVIEKMMRLKDTEPDAAEKEPSPSWHETHSELSNTPANDANCQPTASTDPPQDNVPGNLPDEIEDQMSSGKEYLYKKITAGCRG